jgi:hypothetical protein
LPGWASIQASALTLLGTLATMQSGVDAIASQEFCWAAHLDHATFFHHENLIGLRHSRDPVCNQHRGAPF